MSSSEFTTSEAFAPFSRPALLRIARSFFDRAEPIEIAGPIGGGFSGAAVYQLTTPAGRYALRGWPVDAIPRARLLELHRYVRHLHQAGFPVAVPIPHMDGSTIISADSRQWQIEPWMPGDFDRSELVSTARLNAIVTLLARLHLCSSRYEPSHPGRPWFAPRCGPSPTVAERRQVLAAWTPERLSDAVTSVDQAPVELRHLLSSVLSAFVQFSGPIDRELQAVQSVKHVLHPCLRDLWRDHVLFTGEGVTGLIDLAAARTEHVAADISRLLGSLLGDDHPRWGEALADYERIRPLSPAEHNLIHHFDRSNVLLSGMAWVERWLTGRLVPEQIPAVKQRLDRIVARLQCFSG